MKKTHVITVIFCMAIITALSCNKKESTVTTPDVESRVLGTWAFSAPILPDSTKLALIMKTGSNYSIEVTQKNNKKLFNSTGTWSSTQDSITLSGEECQYYDTVTSRLVDMNTQTCSTPLILPYPDSDTTWSIKTSNFSVALSSLPIPATLLETVYTYFQVIILTRERQ